MAENIFIIYCPSRPLRFHGGKHLYDLLPFKTIEISWRKTSLWFIALEDRWDFIAEKIFMIYCSWRSSRFIRFMAENILIIYCSWRLSRFYGRKISSWFIALGDRIDLLDFITENILIIYYLEDLYDLLTLKTV